MASLNTLMTPVTAFDAFLPSLAFIDGVGGPEMLLILVIVLLLFGGDKLPEFARGMGKTMRELKKAASGVEEEFRRAMDEDERKKAAAAYEAANAANANAELSTKTNYLLSISRFAHYLKIMARDKIGSFMEVSDCEKWLNEWINNYVVGNPGSVSDDVKAQRPLAAAEVRRNAARGGRAVAFTEIPAFLGLPSIHDPGGFWDPFFRACDETGTVVCMHIGSSSAQSNTSADAPPARCAIVSRCWNNCCRSPPAGSRWKTSTRCSAQPAPVDWRNWRRTW